jgi:LmbE family N-acetylglucosaminyl deacetylase
MTDGLSSEDRILMLAPHPDDEAIGAGGLLQRARAVGAKVHVIYGTSGDNNAWPQRFLEKRWNINSTARARWGARRRGEARTALRLLLGSDNCATFLNLPDQGVTSLLLRGGEEIIAALREQFSRLRPTVLVLPSADDTHADHSALYVLARFAFGSGMNACRVLYYVVHPGSHNSPAPECTLQLTEEEVEQKRGAILCHETQMLLSRRRFTAFARVEEKYQLHAPADVHTDEHEIVETSVNRGALRIVARIGRVTLLRRRLYIAVQSFSGRPTRLSILLPSRSCCVDFYDETGKSLPHRATVRVQHPYATIRFPLHRLQPVESAFVKLQSNTYFYDRSGWREIALPASEPRHPLSHKDGAVGQL